MIGQVATEKGKSIALKSTKKSGSIKEKCKYMASHESDEEEMTFLPKNIYQVLTKQDTLF